MDTVDQKTRSRMMARIKSKDTAPEMIVRKGLFARGLRYRLHDNRLPGRPDLIFPKYRAIIQVHGCFWHGHESCNLFKPPSSNESYWTPKIARNRANDERALTQLRELGWRVRVVWECQLKRQSEAAREALLDELAQWVCQFDPG
jgi:DNA mismatch endonuclease, patch repair protein